MDKLACLQHVLAAASARMQCAIAGRRLRYAVLTLLAAVPTLGACPVPHRVPDTSLYDAALDLVQAALAAEDPWQVAAEPDTTATPAAVAVASESFPRRQAPRTAPGADLDELLAVPALRARSARLAATAGSDRAGGPDTIPMATGNHGRMRLAAVSADSGASADGARFRVPPGAPAGNARPHPGSQAPLADSAVPVLLPPPSPVPVLVAGGAEPAPASTPAVPGFSVPPVLPPVTTAGPPSSLPPLPGSSPVPPIPVGTPGGNEGIGPPPVVPPALGGGLPGPVPHRLAEPSAAWLLLLALALCAVTLRRR